MRRHVSCRTNDFPPFFSLSLSLFSPLFVLPVISFLSNWIEKENREKKHFEVLKDLTRSDKTNQRKWRYLRNIQVCSKKNEKCSFFSYPSVLFLLNMHSPSLALSLSSFIMSFFKILFQLNERRNALSSTHFLLYSCFFFFSWLSTLLVRKHTHYFFKITTGLSLNVLACLHPYTHRRNKRYINISEENPSQTQREREREMKSLIDIWM